MKTVRAKTRMSTAQYLVAVLAMLFVGVKLALYMSIAWQDGLPVAVAQIGSDATGIVAIILVLTAVSLLIHLASRLSAARAVRKPSDAHVRGKT